MSTTTSPAPSQASQRPPGTLNENQPGATPEPARLAGLREAAADRLEGLRHGRRIRARAARRRARLDHHHLGEPGAALDARRRPRARDRGAGARPAPSAPASTCPRPRRPRRPPAGASGISTVTSLQVVRAGAARCAADPCARPRRPRAQRGTRRAAPGPSASPGARAAPPRCPRTPAARRGARRAGRDRSRGPRPPRSRERARPPPRCCPGRGSGRAPPPACRVSRACRPIEGSSST